MDKTVCPVCRYALQGLSEPLRCPECGFILGINPAVFRPASAGWLALALSSVGVIIALAVSFAIRSSPQEIWWFLLPLFMLSVGSAYRYSRSRTNFLIVNLDSIRVCRDRHEVNHVELRGITIAKWDWTVGQIVVQDGDSERTLPFYPQSRRRAQAIIRAMESRQT